MSREDDRTVNKIIDLMSAMKKDMERGRPEPTRAEAPQGETPVQGDDDRCLRCDERRKGHHLDGGRRAVHAFVERPAAQPETGGDEANPFRVAMTAKPGDVVAGYTLLRRGMENGRFVWWVKDGGCISLLNLVACIAARRGSKPNG